ncbi:MAG: PAC2 family protein [Actinobacteria bacterium]|nr:PAC2 family protein [Actinomycetota bacterium]
MSELYELIDSPDLESPPLILGLEGWVDAGFAAANAFGTLLEDLDTITVAVFDSDSLLDHRSRRPTMHLINGINAGLSWPSIELRAGVDRVGNEVLFLVGVEPDHRWRAFSSAVVDLAHQFGVSTVYGLGAYPAPVPHTRATRLVATATTPELAALVGSIDGRIDVPAGVHAAIERCCAEGGLPATGLWAQIPHYAAGMPYPAGALALIEGLRNVGGLQFPLGSLVEDARLTRARLDELVANSEEHVAMVRQLEEQIDAIVDTTPTGPLPTGDDLAAELEQFLREQE